MRCDPDTCRDPDLLAREVQRLQALLDETRSAADQADAEYLAEIERLRLTDAEREAIDTAEASLMRESTDMRMPAAARKNLGIAAATLRGLKERMGGDYD